MAYAFHPTHPDYVRSPYTGMTREDWMEAGKHLLRGVFRHIRRFEDPVLVPRQESEITYPHRESPPEWHEAEQRAEIFEGLTRTLFIAAPLLKNEPELTLCGYRLADYYKAQILRVCTPGDPLYVGTYEDMQALTGHADPFRPFQQTVEGCALVIGLWVSRAVIWERCSREEQDRIAALLSSYAHANTVPQNWRLFNMLELAFLHQNGYPIDEEIMLDHAAEILGYYAGDGWYRDGHCFDYYNIWAFQVYAPLWNRWYGDAHAPELAQKFEAQSNRLMESYPALFDADAHVTMWGRSCIYRCAAASAFEGNLYLAHPSVNPGLARRICSGSLLQFLSREDFYYEGVPTIGFYGQFAPLVQGYSCAESPFWLGKSFLCLDLPPEHPFWTATEENGAWETLRGDAVAVTTLNAPALALSNHAANGTTLLRSGKVVKNCGDRHGMWNYGKLVYASKYPWEASPQDGSAVESQQYVLRDETSGREERANVCLWHGERDGVLYRRQFFDYTLERECMWMQALNLADFTVPYGLFRADRIRLYRRPVTLTLGAFGFPDNGTEVLRRQREGAQALILKGKDALGHDKQLAMTIYDGWDTLELVRSRGTNPDSERSIVVYAKTTRKKQYGGAEPYLLLSQVLTRESAEDFTDEDLFPVARIDYADRLRSGGSGAVRILLRSGEEKTVCFEGIEGALLC
ncbi:MAG: DUF2264 domain-containing protein [Oscillospiraceae bacterium]|nr:DUF2264 domain-containing protein [Oscillospiraceae bacterium]